jgi:prepilin-type N-terminal cleavage/methylation domain-containing protein
MRFVKPRCLYARGFTLLELAIVIVIIGILLTMVVGISDSMRARAEKAKCMANLRGLYSGAASYVMDQGHWPQINPRLIRDDSKEYARLWIAALRPYGLSQQNWICATQQRALGNPDLTERDAACVDYNATPFDDRPYTAYQWPTQPWFVEHASVHDGGPLLIYTNGQVVTLTQAMRIRSAVR